MKITILTLFVTFLTMNLNAIDKVMLMFDDNSFVKASSFVITGGGRVEDGSSLSSGASIYINVIPSERTKKAYFTKMTFGSTGEYIAISYISKNAIKTAIGEDEVVRFAYIASKNGDVTSGEINESRPVAVNKDEALNVFVKNLGNSTQAFWLNIHYLEEK